MLLLLIELKMAKFYLLNSLRRNVKSYFVLQPIFSVSILPHALKLQLHFFVPFNLDSPCYMLIYNYLRLPETLPHEFFTDSELFEWKPNNLLSTYANDEF